MTGMTGMPWMPSAAIGPRGKQGSAMDARPLLKLTLGGAAALVGLAGSAAGQEKLTRQSVDSSGIEGNDDSSVDRPSISSDGRYVAFDSRASNLVVGDSSKRTDVFVHDRVTLATVRVSVDSSGVEADDQSLSPDLSSDGRFVAFESAATNLVANDTNHVVDIFIHDRDPDGNGIFDEGNGTTVRVSVSSAGAEADGGSHHASISGDGTLVAFVSRATNLTNGDRNGKADIFVHDLVSGKTTRMSLDSSGNGANGECFTPSMSADGAFVAFLSYANNLVPSDTNHAPDIFVRDRLNKLTTRVSVDSAGMEGDSGCFDATSISDDGSIVVFSSLASNLVSKDANGKYDIFVHDRTSGITTRVSVDSAGIEANDASFYSAVSSDGQFVAFECAADNLVAGDTNGTPDVFVHDRSTGVTTLVSENCLGVIGDTWSHYPSISGDGALVAFTSLAANLIAGDGNQAHDVFVRDLAFVDPDASWNNYGAGFAGTNGIPTLAASADPVLGTQIDVDLGNSLGAPTFGYLLAGVSQASIPTTLGGTLLVGGVFLALPVSIPASGLSLPEALPADLALCGVSIFVQGLELDPGAQVGVSFTPGLELFFGG
jgi:hypothetical protein